MFKSQSSFNNSFFGNYAYAKVIERNQDNILIRLGKAVDLSFIESLVSDCYVSDNGRRAYNPVIMFKILFLQTLYDLSDRQAMEQVDTNILFRYFTGLSMDDDIPHFTLLGKFKDRLGEGRFEAVFNRIVSLAVEAGLVDNRLRLIDCSAVKAKVDLFRCKKDKKDDDDHGFIDRNTSDPDASTGYKTKSDKWYGYKTGIAMDAESEIVTAVTTTTARTADTKHLPDLVEKDIAASGGAKRVCADKGFQGHDKLLKAKRIINNIIRRDNMKKPRRLIYYLDKMVRPIIEHKFGEGKKYHGLGKARYWGRSKIHIQSLLAYLVMNLKKITNRLVPVN
jgi:IS5 family transposase